MPEDKEVFRLKAPDKVKGTNWHLNFYNEVVKVEDRVAFVTRPGNRDDLLRRGWTLVDGEVSEEDKANEAARLEEAAKLFSENFAELIEEAKGLPGSDELTSAIETSEKALEEAKSERDMSIACRAMTTIMDKVKADAAQAGDGESAPAKGEEKKGKGLLGKLKDKLTGKGDDAAKPDGEGAGDSADEKKDDAEDKDKE